MPLHAARRAANVGGRSGVGGAVCHFVCEEVFSGAFEQAMRWSARALMETRYDLVVDARLCSVERILAHRRCA